jgi:hypothetical protein
MAPNPPRTLKSAEDSITVLIDRSADVAGAFSHLDFGGVMPAQAAIQCPIVDSRLRGNDARPLF